MRLRYFGTLIFIFAVHAVSAHTLIYTTTDYPVTAADTEPGVQVLVLDEAQRLEQALFPALTGTSNAQQAEQQAQQRMQQADWKEAEARLTAAYQSLLSAWSLGVEKVPAVVFDDRYVVYGTTDIRLAQQKWTQWQEQQR
ncbi:TIGR03757 family integrating conjugative element protein [Salmonella enterica subsp. enterica]|nr:TIGR03757 family integrating conjugative element protein [Salmonella enterica subsp. enterica]MIF51124.1 TIGR03757 family integrating conjugative element protein [Salmonella enterica subsp. enterica]